MAVSDRGRDRHPRRRWRNLGLGMLLAVLPWTWFLVRDDLGAVSDVFASLLPLLAALLAIGAGLAARRGHRVAVVLALSTVVAAAVAVVGPWLPADQGRVAGKGLTIAATNIDGRDASDTLLDISADVLVVPEATKDGLSKLQAGYPDEYVWIYNNAPDIAVFSRYPLRLLEPVGPDLPGVRLEVTGPDGPFVLYALHVPRPWFRGRDESNTYQATVREHQRLVDEVAVRVRAEALPVVLAGDLNSTDRGRDYRVLLAAGLVDAMRDSLAAPTSVGKWLPLLARIDHVLVSRGWCGDGARRVELPASSTHRGVLVTVGRCATP